MKLHNSLTRALETIHPLDTERYRIYSCGPTVYDHAHIGNLSAYVFADTLRRALATQPYAAPKHVMNYTDVDDKTIRRSRERYPDLAPREALRRLTDDYIATFHDDMAAVGNDLAAIDFIRATDSIDGMTRLISQLHAAGYAYVADDGVYFSIETYRASGKQYGQLVKLTTANTSAARINNDEYDKESVHDFALWKTAKPDEPAWPFSLEGVDLTGRPGWHIECSVMSRDGLGQPFDVHTGGIDLQFPHHENEIAQSTALESDPRMAAVFAHNDHILVDGKKMAKSAANFYTLSDIVAKGFDPLAFRLLVLQSHYRNPVNFSWDSLEAAQNRLQGLRALADRRFQLLDTPEDTAPDFREAASNLEDSLSKDVDTPQALAGLAKFESSVTDNNLVTSSSADFMHLLTAIDGLLGLGLMQSSDITPDQKTVLQSRQTARDTKDWATSDALRNQLQSQDIGLRDTPHGAIWFRL